MAEGLKTKPDKAKKDFSFVTSQFNVYHLVDILRPNRQTNWTGNAAAPHTCWCLCLRSHGCCWDIAESA